MVARAFSAQGEKLLEPKFKGRSALALDDSPCTKRPPLSTWFKQRQGEEKGSLIAVQRGDTT